MNDHKQDSDLRAQFDTQRCEDAKNAPSFAVMISRANAAVPRTARVGHRREWLGGLAAAAVIAAVIVIPRTRDGDRSFEEAVRAFSDDPALGAWQSPTDALLRSPGDGLLTTIPSIGGTQ